MKNIFRFLSKAKSAVAVIIILLIVQAYCDLALPTYTSDLLNVGLQQNGIEDAVPETIRRESLDTLELFLTDAETETLEASYSSPDDNGVCKLKDTEDADREKLHSILSLPESVVFQMAGSEEGAAGLEQIKDAVASGMMTKEDFRQQMQDALAQMEGMTDTFLDQVAVSYVAAEYEAQNVDLNEIRNAYLWKVGMKMLAMALVMAVIAILTGYIASVVSAGIGRDLREQLYSKVMGFTSAEIEKFSTASLITRCTNDIQQVQMLVVMLLRMVTYAPILAIAGIIKVIQTGSQMSWIIVAAVIALAVCISVLFAIAYPKFKVMQKLVDRLNLVSRELLTGVMPIRAFGRQKYEEERFAKANTDLFKTQLFTNRTMTFMMPVMTLIMNGVSVLIVWVGGQGVDAGTVQIGNLTAFITYSMVIIMSFLMLSMISIMLPRAGVAADRIVEVLETEVSLVDAPDTKDKELEHMKGVLAFSDVSFAYPGAEAPVLKHISFTAEPGKTTAIIGSTGCGKSTLVHLIPRFYDVSEGSITLDGVDIRELSQKKLRDSIGYVPQKGVLFSGTVESNLKYGGEQITDEDMESAAAISQAVEFIEAKEAGYQAPIAQNGSNVSGGQRQRLSIARAVAKHPQIYLFDDSFSALDYKTDAALRSALAKQTGSATVIIVAQRISTIMHADQILVMEDGCIVGMGTHRELLENCETYMEIARGQLSEEEIQSALKGED
ncbi:MAG: ABC transporter ATP-binding protein/permease [Muribaculaceae bacterium]|nr:ABC transporter ATP-binding protein/permease [Muribaculaceae bacterium]